MKEHLRQISEFEWLIPKSLREGMNVDAKLIASKAMLPAIEEEAVKQLTNVAMLPGVLEPVVAMPDAHWGYGLPVGAVGAFDPDKGIISAGMTGFDINCGINTLRTNLTVDEAREKLRELIATLFRNVPCGVGSKGRIKLSDSELDDVMTLGVGWTIDKGYGTKNDKEHTEETGCMPDAEPNKVSELARSRGKQQIGTLGAGNHFLEVQGVDNIFDAKTAKKYGLFKGQALIMIHCGSRGFGHQVATDFLAIHGRAAKNYGIKLPDQQLVCAPISSREGQDYFGAMKCAVNYAFVNRQIIANWTRETFQQVFKMDADALGMDMIYGLAHNICKVETHTIGGTHDAKGKIKGGEKREVYVHRKGATRSFPATPVLIAGSMGTASYILQGTKEAMIKTFGSTCHGAGRAMSRTAAINNYDGRRISDDLASRGIIARATNPKVLAEEAPMAYKDIESVIDSVHGAGISTKVARVVPMGVVKG